jgi:thioredoxin 1
MIRLFIGLLLGAALGYGAARIPRAGGGGLLGCSPWRGLLAGALIGLLVGATLGQSGRVSHPSPHLVTIRDAAHCDAVLASNRVVLVGFYSDLNTPSLLLKPALHDLADAFYGRALVVAVDVDRCRPLAIAHRVGSIPDVRVIVDGQVQQAWGEAQDPAVYAAVLEATVAKRSGR